MNTKKLKRRLIKAIYKMNPKDEIIRGYAITAIEKIGKKIFMRYCILSEITYHYSRIELDTLSFLEIVCIYEKLKKHDTGFRIFRPW